jgi:hypothetical protein
MKERWIVQLGLFGCAELDNRATGEEPTAASYTMTKVLTKEAPVTDKGSMARYMMQRSPTNTTSLPV